MEWEVKPGHVQSGFPSVLTNLAYHQQTRRNWWRTCRTGIPCPVTSLFAKYYRPSAWCARRSAGPVRESNENI